MKIPKVISKGKHVYIIEQEYPNFILYKNMMTGVKECFHIGDLVRIEQKVRPSVNKWEREERKI